MYRLNILEPADLVKEVQGRYSIQGAIKERAKCAPRQSQGSLAWQVEMY